jgi:two-component system response regulator HydG
LLQDRHPAKVPRDARGESPARGLRGTEMDVNRLRILVVDDQSSVRELLKAVLEEDGHEVETAPDGETAIAMLRSSFHDLVVMDIRMPGIDGVQALEQMKSASRETAVIMMTAYASVETAVQTMKLGAIDYVTKPIDIEEVRRVISRFIASAATPAGEMEPEEPTSSSDVVGASDALRDVLELAHRVAESDASVLILGESGTGKEVIAREIVRASDRARRPFVAVNCSAIPEGLLESELFGHEKGSFTGAIRQKRGRFELADRGTILLDEIGDMSQALQSKLLRFLQDHTFQRVGGSKDITVDVRVIAATNKDLDREVAEGGFREDLFFRLNVVAITMPPLRDRLEDVPLLVDHFLRSNATAGTKPKKISPRAMRLAMSYDWPGNVRELENAIQRAVVLSRGETIFPEHLPAKIQAAGTDADGVEVKTGKTMREVERDTIAKTLRQTEGNRTHAAKILGVSRRTLQNKIKEYGIDL